VKSANGLNSHHKSIKGTADKSAQEVELILHSFLQLQWSDGATTAVLGIRLHQKRLVGKENLSFLEWGLASLASTALRVTRRTFGAIVG